MVLMIPPMRLARVGRTSRVMYFLSCDTDRVHVEDNAFLEGLHLGIRHLDDREARTAGTSVVRDVRPAGDDRHVDALPVVRRHDRAVSWRKSERSCTRV